MPDRLMLPVEQLQPICVGADVAAKLLGISERSLASHSDDGLVPSFRLKGRRLWCVDVLRRWAADQCGIADRPYQPMDDAEKANSGTMGREMPCLKRE
jgi:hypothetical protein